VLEHSPGLFELRPVCKGLCYNARAAASAAARCHRAEIVAALETKLRAHARAVARQSSELCAVSARAAAAEAVFRQFNTWFGRRVLSIARMHARGRLSDARKCELLKELEQRRDSGIRARRSIQLRDAHLRAAEALRASRRALALVQVKLQKVQRMLVALQARTDAGR
jgi:hypothetical protein